MMINGRMPEHIKAGLRCRVTGDTKCSDCAYYGTVLYEIGQREYECDDIDRDALSLIEHLESERDAALAKVPKWISVKDSKKPRHGQECLCICAMENDPKHEWDYQMVLKWYAYGSNGLVDRPHFQHEGCEGMTVTHWMPLPEPTKGE